MNMDLSFLDTQYDHKLKSIDHFCLHPEMLPYVGLQYDISRLLFVGESHYVSCSEQELPELVFKNWYMVDTSEIFRNLSQEAKKYIKWFDTRNVVSNFQFHLRSRAHTMFSNPADVIREILGEKFPTDSTAFCCVAFYNYFQRPSTTYGKTIFVNSEDSRVARDTFLQIADILQPECVIFLSRKAWSDFGKETIADACGKKIPLFRVDHPTSPWWHLRGKFEFKAILNDYLQQRPFANMIDERIWLLGRLFEEFYEVFLEKGLRFNKCPENLLTDFYNLHSKPYILLEGGTMLEIDHRPYVTLPNKSFEYLPSSGQSKKEVPNFRTNNYEYRQLYDKQKRSDFIKRSMQIINKII